MCLVGKMRCTMPQLCLVEDETDLLEILSLYLRNNGWDVIPLSTMLAANEYITTPVDLWVLDIMLPDGSGIELLKNIKAQYPEMPVIFISARGDSIDRVLGFEVGCDDYIAKPFLPIELVYRANKFLNTETTTGNTAQQKDSLDSFDTYHIDRKKRIVYDADTPVSLTSKEYEIVLYFLDNSSTALSRESILLKVWGNDFYGSDRVIDNYIKKLRKKLPNFSLETIYGFGYRFNI